MQRVQQQWQWGKGQAVVWGGRQCCEWWGRGGRGGGGTIAGAERESTCKLDGMPGSSSACGCTYGMLKMASMTLSLFTGLQEADIHTLSAAYKTCHLMLPSFATNLVLCATSLAFNMRRTQQPNLAEQACQWIKSTQGFMRHTMHSCRAGYTRKIQPG